MNKQVLYLILFIILAVVLYIVYRNNFKILKVPSVCEITGGVKTGKSLLSVKLSQLDFRKRHFKWWFATKILHKKLEEPLYYTNTTSSFKNIRGKKPHRLDRCIVNITREHLLREIRFNYKSVIYINEASLFADNMDYKNEDRNTELSLFNKLIGHETRGGALYYDTQSPLDCHYSIKRVASTYFFIFKSFDLFFFRILYLREMINTENGVNNFDKDVDFTQLKVLVPRWWYKRYDRYEFSYLTDNLPLNNTAGKFKTGLLSFNPSYVKHGNKALLQKKENEKKEVN